MVSNHTSVLTFDECLKLQDKSRKLQVAHAILEASTVTVAIIVILAVSLTAQIIWDSISKFCDSVQVCGVRISGIDSGESRVNDRRCSLSPSLEQVHVHQPVSSPPEYTSATVGDYYGGSASGPANNGRSRETWL